MKHIHMSIVELVCHSCAGADEACIEEEVTSSTFD